MTVIAVVDYGMGNRRSVEKALEHVGARAVVTRDHDQIHAADGLVIPGVGAFPLAMRRLDEFGLSALIRARAAAGVPVLGLCLGMQLLFERSEELEPTDGLGLIEGDVTALRTGGLRIPHIGWNDVSFRQAGAVGAVLIEGLPGSGCAFYHVHSFAARPTRPEDVVGTTEYGETFATIVARDAVMGVQFHPEKSSAHGLQMLGNFARVCASAPRGPSGSSASSLASSAGARVVRLA
jgi:glutamine amidotransferase